MNPGGAFDRVASGRPVVLVGAGNLGRRVAQAMIDDGAAPVAFADGGRALHDTRVAGVPVLPVEEAVRLHPGAAFVVTIWGARSTHRIAHTEARLRELGVTCIVPFPHLMWKHRSTLPHYCVDAPEIATRDADRVAEAARHFADEASRAEYASQVAARIDGRFDRLPEPATGEPYIDTGLFSFRDDEVVVDGGAFDGDSLRGWLARRGVSFARWYAVEPQPAQREAIQRTIDTMPASRRDRVTIVAAALGSSPGRARLLSQGAGSRIGADGGEEVVVTTLDLLTADRRPTLVKLDIEGAELDALSGATGVLERDRPVFAVCAYHRMTDLWELPLFFAKRARNYELFLRPHGAEGWDLVLYAIPRERRA